MVRDSRTRLHRVYPPVNLCVFCASSQLADDRYHAVARDVGEWLGSEGHTLVYGGGNVGLMGTLAKTVHAAEGTVVGFIPARLQAIEGRAYDVADELHVTDTMAQRKHGMYERADAFLVLPGGVGTLEEFFEVLTLKKLGYHNKPIVVLNAFGIFDPLQALLRHVDAQKFSPGISADGTVTFVESSAEAIDKLRDSDTTHA